VNIRTLGVVFRFLTLIVVLTSMLAAQSRGHGGKMEPSVHRANRQPASTVSESARIIRSMDRPARTFSLAPLTGAETQPVTRKPGLKPVGQQRELPAGVLDEGEWSITPSGSRVWRLAIKSPGAEAIRIRFADFHVGAGKVWLFDAQGDESEAIPGPYIGDGLFGNGEFWSDLVMGDSVIVVYEPAADASIAQMLPFKPVAVSHRFPGAPRKTPALNVSPADETATPLAAAASCAIDVTCHSEYNEPASAVALIVFESGGETYQCTGSLISSASQPALPFFLTANHCISNDQEARSAITIFNYQTPTCGGAPPALSTLPRVTGASFVSGRDMAFGDFTLLRLSAFPTVDVKLLGWTSEAIAMNERVVGISHPMGDYKRIAFGERTRDVTIRFSSGERMPADKGYQVSWLQGLTQTGSSGSPLLIAVGDKHYATGTLSAGPDIDDEDAALACRASNTVASYGRFSEAFPYLSSFLTSSDGGGAPSVPSTQPFLSATPNPIFASAGRATGRTTLTWQAAGYSAVQIRVGSPIGPAMTGIEGARGTAETGDWVASGMVFYLQDASDGSSLGSFRTLAVARVDLIRN
jgi:lysyl endopeptidase